MKKIFNGIDIISNSISSEPTIDIFQSKSISSSTGDQHIDLEHIEIKFNKNNDEYLSNQKHSTNNNSNISTTSSGGFSLKNPVSSFRSWVTNKKSSKEDSTINHPRTTYGKIDTSPTRRKSSISSDKTKRTRTNSASATTTSSVTNNNYQQQQLQQIQSNSSSSTRVKKKSSFTLRNTNPITLLKRTSETSHNQTDLSSTEQTGAGGGGGGPFGYLKHLVRGDSSSSEKKQ